MNTQKKKKQSPQDEADRIFALQTALAPKGKRSDRMLIGVFLAALLAGGVGVLALPDTEFSEQENRYLQTMPKLQSTFSGTILERIQSGKFLDKYFSGDFADKISDYFSDQFPLRNLFVGVKGACELALGKGENNGVVVGKNGYLLTRMDDADSANVAKNAAAVETFTATMAEYGIPVTFAVAGRTIDVMEDALPAFFPDTYRDVWDALADTAYLNLRDVLLPYAENGENVMYRTDHHWTTKGAYLAYAAILRAWGEEPYPEEQFTVETASDNFYGTAWRTAGIKWIAPDEILFYRYDGDTDYTLTIHDDETTIAGFYDTDYLSVTDQYSVFLSGNRAYETIEKNGGDEDRERLLLVKDSFAHSLAPFLARNYDLEIVDLRYYKNSVAALARETGCDRVLILYNMESLTDAANLGLLQMGE